jgi:hypothetical protein
VQAWVRITFVTIHVTGLSFIPGITLTETVHTGSIRSTIYPHTRAGGVTKVSYVAVPAYTISKSAVTMLSAVYSVTKRVGLQFKNKSCRFGCLVQFVACRSHIKVDRQSMRATCECYL